MGRECCAAASGAASASLVVTVAELQVHHEGPVSSVSMSLCLPVRRHRRIGS